MTEKEKADYSGLGVLMLISLIALPGGVGSYYHSEPIGCIVLGAVSMTYSILYLWAFTKVS